MKYILIPLILTLSACAGSSTGCPPKSDTEVIMNGISDILVPKIRLGC